jgi:hypothetical protein
VVHSGVVAADDSDYVGHLIGNLPVQSIVDEIRVVTWVVAFAVVLIVVVVVVIVVVIILLLTTASPALAY